MHRAAHTTLDVVARRTFVACAAIPIFVALGAPLTVAVIVSFTSQEGVTDGQFFGNYATVLSGHRLVEYCRIMLRGALVATSCIALALPATYWLVRHAAGWCRTLFLFCILLQFFVSDALRAFGWQWLLSPIGPISNLWQSVPVVGGPLDGLRYNWWAPLVGLIASMVPFAVFAVLAAIPRANSNLWKVAEELRGRPFFVFRRITWPLAVPGVCFGWAAVFILACVSSNEAKFLDGPTQNSLSSVVASLANIGVPALSALTTLITVGLVCLGLSLSILVKFVLVTHEGRKTTLRTNDRRSAAPPSLGRAGEFLFALICRGVVFLIVVLTLASPTAVAVISFTNTDGMELNWTANNYLSALQSPVLKQALATSLFIAGLVALSCSFLGALLALSFWRARLRWAVLGMLALAATIPPDSYALSLQQAIRQAAVEGGGLGLVLVAHILWALPFVTGFIMLSYGFLDFQMLASAVELGAAPHRLLLHVIIPITAPTILSSALLAALLSLNEASRSAYLAGSSRVLATEVYGKLASGLVRGDRGIYAIASMVMFASAIFGGIWLLRARAEQELT